jgi:hypothetical protein
VVAERIPLAILRATLFVHSLLPYADKLAVLSRTPGGVRLLPSTLQQGKSNMKKNSMRALRAALLVCALTSTCLADGGIETPPEAPGGGGIETPPAACADCGQNQPGLIDGILTTIGVLIIVASGG